MEPNSKPITGEPAKTNTGAPPPPQSKESTFFRRFLIFMFAFYLLFGSAVLSAWLVLRPRVPEFQLHSASVSNFTIHNYTASYGHISGTWHLGFHFHNPSQKISISYHNLTSAVYYREYLLAKTPIHQTQTSIDASFSGSKTIDGSAFRELNEERSGRSVDVEAKIEGSVTFRLSGWRPRTRFLTVACADVAIRISVNGGSGIMMDGPLECSVEY